MTEEKKATRLSKAAREFNVGISTIIEFLSKKGFQIDSNPNTKLPAEVYDLLVKEYSSDLSVKKESEKLALRDLHKKKETLSIEDVSEGDTKTEKGDTDEEIIIKDTASPKKEEIVIDSEEEKKPVEEQNKTAKSKTAETAETKEPEEDSGEKREKEPVKSKTDINIVGKIDLDALKKRPSKKSTADKAREKKATEEPKEESSKEGKITKNEKETAATDETAVKKQEESTKEVQEKSPVTEEKIEITEEKAQTSTTTEKTEIPEEKTEIPEEKTKIPEEKTVTDTELPPKGEDKETQKEEVIAREKESTNIFKTERTKLSGPTVIGKMELPVVEKRKSDKDSGDDGSDSDEARRKKKKRKRIRKDKEKVPVKQEGKQPKESATTAKKKKKRAVRPEVSEEDVQKQVKETLARLTSKGKTKGSKYRREKRDSVVQKGIEEVERREQEKNVIKVTEFVSVNELASMMDTPVTEVISTCLNLGLMVSINQRLDAETMALVAEEFGYKAEFVSAELKDAVKEVEDKEEDLKPRSPIVTVMGHVDHGKTKLLDHVRNANVIAGEAGGITQHIGAYNVKLNDGRTLTFLDTPGHEAFTAMRARGAQITDVAIIVVAADDGVMPQTREAINHASAAGVPIVFAINKIDKPAANAERIKEELAQMNYLVEDWGGKYQSQEISALNGMNVDLLLDKVLLEAELLELKANPDKPAVGTVIESSLDKGRGYVATVLIKAGTLKVGDIVLAGSHYGHVKALQNERGKPITEAGPSMPVLILGLNGAPQAGDNFNIMESDKEAKDIASRRQQLQREQDMRTQKHITLDEIGRRIAIGNFQELNIIVKGDVDGSVEALSDSLIKLSTPEIQLNVIHKAVGQISESDILLAAASNAIIVGFQVRPSISARKLAEQEQIDVRLYSIIYSAIEEIRSAMEGMLSPEEKEEITGTAEIREVFKITKVGSVAGCIVREGKITRNSKIRVIRDGIVIYTGELGSLKRFKDDVKEVSSGYECGLNVENFNDIKVGDMIECFKVTEVKKTL